MEKLEALTWFNRDLRQDTTATLEKISLALRNDFGQEYAGAQAFRDMWRVKMDFTLNGSQHLRVLNQLEERVRQLRECTPWARVSAVATFDSRLFQIPIASATSPSSPRTRSAQTQRRPCGGLRKPWTLLATQPGSVRPATLSSPPPTPAREALFALRVELTEEFLRRIICPGSGGYRDRPACVL